MNRTQLTEALAAWNDAPTLDTDMLSDEVLEALDTMAEAARILLDFPTDEMVRAAAITQDTAGLAVAQLQLEAVRRVMLGGDDD